MDINVSLLVLEWYICNFKVYKDIEVILDIYKDIDEIFPSKYYIQSDVNYTNTIKKRRIYSV